MEAIEMKSSPFLAWLLGLIVSINIVFNVAVLYALSSVYDWDDFKSDFMVHSVKNKIETDNIKIPPVKVIKFISAYNYQPTQVAFIGESLYIFIKFDLAIKLSEGELEAVVVHEIGHYVLGHLDYGPVLYNQTPEIEDPNKQINKEIEADLFAVIYSDRQALSSAIKKMVWDEKERDIRIGTLGTN